MYGVITRKVLKEKASTIWQGLSQYQGIQEPKWLNGWLEGFKKRHKIKEYVIHSKVSSTVVNSPEMITQMADV
jgi:hypothetical protein